MSKVAKRLYATDETFREVADLLFGGGADELVSKINPEQKMKDKKQRRQAQVALGGNVLGLAAGGAALATAGKNPALKLKTATPETAGPATKRALKYIKTAKGKGRLIQAGAAGAVGLQAANTIGDVAGNIVLRREVKKSEPGSSDIHIPSVGKLKRVAGKKAYEKAKPQAKKAGTASLKAINELPPVDQVKTKIGRKIAKSDVVWEGEFSKVDTDKRQVFGWASIVEVDGKPVVDLQGDYIDIDEIEKSAYEYVIKSRKGGDMHRRNVDDSPVHASDMIESFIVTPEKKEKLGLPDSMPTGWWVGYQINDDEAWNLVKSGKRTGFSIHGRGQRTPSEI